MKEHRLSALIVGICLTYLFNNRTSVEGGSQ